MSDATKISTEDYNQEEIDKIVGILQGCSVNEIITIGITILVEKGLITSKDVKKLTGC